MLNTVWENQINSEKAIVIKNIGSYSQSQAGVGGRKKKKVEEKSKVLTYFDKLKLAQSQSKGKCTFCLF